MLKKGEFLKRLLTLYNINGKIKARLIPNKQKRSQQMKKTISLSLICLVLVCSLLSLTSCSSMLMGKYTGDIVLAKITYEFEPFGKVTKTTDPFIGDTVTVEGKYVINDEGTKITFTFDDEAETFDFVRGEEGGVQYIKIGSFKYDKID